jgi:hypothetical protein
MKDSVFSDVTTCESCYNRGSVETCCLSLEVGNNRQASNNVSSN